MQKSIYKFIDIIPHYNIYSSISPKVSKENAFKLLEEHILLYILIWSHSLGKYVKETYKMKI